MWDEVWLVETALERTYVKKSSPISHLVPRVLDLVAWRDYGLGAMGGFSINMNFWWYIKWPPMVKQSTLHHILNGTTGKLIDINCLKYATTIINCTASIYYWCIDDNRSLHHVKYSTTLIWAASITVNIWTKKVAKTHSWDNLGCLQCVLMINNPVGINTDHVSIHDSIIVTTWFLNTNMNLTGYFTSHSSNGILLVQNQWHFHPNPDLLSAIMDSLLSAPMTDPLSKNALAFNSPWRIVT